MQVSLAPDLEFVGEASNGEQAVAVARQQRPDVLLMDVRMPVLDGIDATRRIVGDATTTQRSGHRADDLRSRRLRLRRAPRWRVRVPAQGRHPGELLAAIRVVADGGALIAPQVTRRLIAEFAARPGVWNGRIGGSPNGSPSGRSKCSGLVARGLTNTEIADRLVLSS